MKLDVPKEFTGEGIIVDDSMEERYGRTWILEPRVAMNGLTMLILGQG